MDIPEKAAEGAVIGTEIGGAMTTAGAAAADEIGGAMAAAGTAAAAEIGAAMAAGGTGGSAVGGVLKGAIGIAGIVLAPATAGWSTLATAGTSGFSLGGIVPRAERGWHVPAGRGGLPSSFGTDSVLSALTPDEMVLPVGERPSEIADRLSEQIAGISGGDTHIHNHFHMLDMRTLRDRAPDIINAINKGLRHGSPGIGARPR
jgi:hypothetical protein